jgi:formate dehydrogenase gamma subunit
MAGTITPPREASAALHRFDLVERAVHWVNAVLFGVLLATAAALYVAPISAAVGRREVVKTIHVYAGLALPLPLLLGTIGRRWGRGLRADLGRLNRWIPDDRRWLGAKLRRRPLGDVRLGKFNPGQKINAAFTGGAIVVMLATGSIMRWYKPWPLRWRTGATFVHDWVATILVVAIAGHIYLALADSDSLGAMQRGTISRAWARRHAPRWLEEAESGD